jgi:hypothetical protein
VTTLSPGHRWGKVAPVGQLKCPPPTVNDLPLRLSVAGLAKIDNFLSIFAVKNPSDDRYWDSHLRKAGSRRGEATSKMLPKGTVFGLTPLQHGDPVSY